MKTHLIFLALSLCFTSILAQKDCEDAHVLTSGCTVTIEQTVGIGEPEELFSCMGVENGSYWFTFTPTVSGVFEMLITPLAPTDFDWTLYAWSCPDGGNAAEIACNYYLNYDVTGIANEPELTFGVPFNLGFEQSVDLQAGIPYYLLVDNFDASGAGFTIEFSGNALPSASPGEPPVIVSNSPLACPPDSAQACQRVCANSTITYEAQDLPPSEQVTWQVTGAETFSADGNQVTVQWGEPGEGEVVAELPGSDGTPPLQVFCGQTGLDLQENFADGRVRFFGGTFPYNLQLTVNGNTIWTTNTADPGWFHLDSLTEVTYQIKVTDANGEMKTCTFTPTLDPQDCWVTLIPSTVGQPQACDLCTGAIYTQIFSSTGSQNLSYTWSTGNSTQHHTGLCQGTYQVTVTNSAGCTGTASVQLFCPEPTCPAPSSLCVEILQTPKAAFSTTPATPANLLQICQGQEVFFENASQDAATYAWIFGDGSTSADASPSHAYLFPGTFTAALVARNDCFCADTAILTIEVLPANLPEIDCVGSVCEGDVVTYSTPSDGCGSFNWSFSGNAEILGGGGAGDDFVTVEWLPGQAEGWISLQTDGCGTAADCPAANVVPVAILSDQVQIQGPDKVCDGQTAEYYIPDYQGTEIGWQVSGAGTIVSPSGVGGGTNRVVVEWAAGLPNPQQVIVWFDNCFLGCSGQDTLLVNIRPDFYVEGGIEFCQNDAGLFAARNAVTDALVPCHWQVLNASGSAVWSSAAAASSASVPFDFPGGNYVVRAVPGSVSSFCNGSFEVPIHVFANPAAVGGILGELQICPDVAYTYSAQGLGDNGFEWTIQDGSTTSTATGNPINVTWGSASPRTLTVTQISANGLLCASEPFSLSVSEFPPVSVSGTPKVCLEGTGSYSASPLQNVDYHWSISPPQAGAILGGQGSASATVFWRQAGNATVQVSTCASSASFPVEILPLPQPVVPGGEVCFGQTLQVQTSQPFLAYAWKTAGGATVSNLPTPSLGAGNFTVQVTDQQGCAGAAIFEIVQRPLPNITLDVPFQPGLCPGGLLDVYVTTLANGLDFQWTHNGSPVPPAAGGNSPHLVATLVGNYQLVATDPHGCTVSRTLIVKSCEDEGGICEFGNCLIPPDTCDVGDPCLCGGFCPDCDPCPPGCLPLGNISFDISPTADCNVHQYVNTSSAFDPASLAWKFGDPGSGAQNSSTQLNPSHVFPAPGFYLIKLSGLVQSANLPGEFCPDLAVKDDTILAVANFEASAACPGSPVNFTDRTEFLPFANLTAWHWDFGDPSSGAANFSTDQNPAHVFASPGTYLVKMTVTVFPPSGAGGGCQTSFSKNVVVHPLPTVSFTPPAAGCGGTAFQFQSTATGGVVKYAWNFGDPAAGSANASSQANPLHVFDAAGTYPVALAVTNGYGCTAGFSAPVEVVANTLTGGIAFSQPPPICDGDSIVLTASGSPSGGGGGGGSVSFSWSNGSAANQITVKQSAIYKVTLTDQHGCTFSPPPAVVDVLGAPNANVQAVEFNEFGQPVAIFTDSYEACDGDPVHLQVIGELGYDYVWSTGSTGETLEFTEDKDNLLPVGTHVFTVTVTNSATGCTSAEGISVVIHPKPVVAIASFPTGFLCENTPATLAVSSPQPATSYVWNTGEPGTSISVISGGKYFAVAANAFGCTARSNEIEVQTAPGANKFPLGCLTRCLPAEICLPDLPTVVSWQWYLNGAPVPAAAGGNLPSPSFTQSGDYQVEMTDLYGCVSLSGILTLDLLTGYGTVGGQVFFDVNDNGVIDPADSTVSGVPVILTGAGGAPPDTMSSNPTGNFIFTDILSTNYSLQIDTANLPTGWVAVLQNADFELVGCDDEAGQDFLLTQICLPTTSTLEMSACEGGEILYAGTPVPAGASQTFTFASFGGCDSVVTVNVAALPPSDTVFVELSACEGQTVNFAGQILSPGEQFNWLTTNQFGCDSVVSVSVILLPPSDTVFVELSACEGQTVNFNGQILSPGDQLNWLTTNQFGCDSVVSVSVVALLATDTTFTLFESCGQQAVTFQGQEIQPGEQATFTFQSWQGCDSTVTVSVAALPVSDTTFVQLAACPGETVSFNGQTLSPGQQFNWLGVNEFGCDSLVAVSVFALPTSDTTFVQLAACEGGTVIFNGVEIAAGDQINLVVTGAQGCDSLVLVSVTANPASQTSLQLAACAGQTIEFNGQQLSPGTEANWLGINQFGCDSLVLATVILLPHLVEFVDAVACQGEFVEILGQQILAGTQTILTQTNAAGCLDTFFVSVAELPTGGSQLQLTACPGSTVEYLGVPLFPGDSAVVVFANQWGCDSTVTVLVEAAPQDTVFDFPLVCPDSATVVYNGQNFAVGDEAVFVFTSSAGCDSIVKIKVLQAPTVDFWATTEPVCFGSEQGYIEFWNHATITEPFEFSIDGGQTFHDLYKFTGLAGGHYEIAAQDRLGCVFDDDIFIPTLPPLLVQVPGEVATCVDSIPLEFSVSQPALPFTWQWQSPAQAGGGISTDSIFWATLPGDYLLTVANECDTVNKTVVVRLEEDSPLSKVYVPNSFSPNGDGFNDCFRGYVAPDLQLLEYQLEIFDRWGNHVFGTREVEGCWDGKFRERWMDPAVLVWYVKMKVVNCRGEVEEVFKEGGVTIVR